MSTEIVVINGTDERGITTSLDQFAGPNHSLMIQITQGLGGISTPGYIQLNRVDALSLAIELTKWAQTLIKIGP